MTLPAISLGRGTSAREHDLADLRFPEGDASHLAGLPDTALDLVIGILRHARRRGLGSIGLLDPSV